MAKTKQVMKDIAKDQRKINRGEAINKRIIDNGRAINREKSNPKRKK
jgi:hypothetical protein